MAPRRTIQKGTLVSVKPSTASRCQYSEGGVGFVQKKKRRHLTEGIILTQDSSATTQTGESLFDVRYTLNNRLSQDVEKDRVSVAQIQPTARARQGNEDELRPFILSPQHQPRTAAAASSSAVSGPTQLTLKKYSFPFLMEAANQFHSSGEQLLILCLLRKKKTDTKGWLRRMEASYDAPVGYDATKKQHLFEPEKRKAMDLLNAAIPHASAYPLVAFAFGISLPTIHDIRKKVMASKGGTSVAQKVRADKGKNLVNSNAKRQSVYTPKFVFENKMRSDPRNDGTITKQEIDLAWNNASTDKRQECALMAEEWKEQGPFLLLEIARALHSTAGAIPWRRIATLVSGAGNLQSVSYSTIRKRIMETPDFAYKTTRILPKLDKACIEQRYWWAQQF